MNNSKNMEEIKVGSVVVTETDSTPKCVKSVGEFDVVVNWFDSSGHVFEETLSKRDVVLAKENQFQKRARKLPALAGQISRSCSRTGRKGFIKSLIRRR